MRAIKVFSVKSGEIRLRVRLLAAQIFEKARPIKERRSHAAA